MEGNNTSPLLRVSPFVRMPLVALAVGWPIYEFFTKQGLPQKLTELQISLFKDSYYPMLSVILPMVLYLMVVVGIAFLCLKLDIFTKPEEE